jgi:MoxR-like ATPase
MSDQDDYQVYTGASLEKFSPRLQYKLSDEAKYKGKIESIAAVAEEQIAPYFPSDKLVKAVEYARILKRPLLLRGEPGCGKTKLAQAVAYELYGDSYREKYFEWHIKSTSKAKDGLYTYDHLARLRDVELLRRRGGELPPENEDELLKYRRFGPLGKAFLNARKGKPSILLIDEIDKADLDFPNDLLLELDQKRFYIEETREKVIAEEAPIIFITSNDEKELPNAFLRRCVYHYIDPPGIKDLIRIAQANADILEARFEKAMPKQMVKRIVERFGTLRNDMKANPDVDKLPSTSELIDWLKVIYFHFLKGAIKADELFDGNLMFKDVLLKSKDDQKIVKGKDED